MEECKHFSHDDDERTVDETTLALQLLAVPQDLDPELSAGAVVSCIMGATFAAGMIIATFKTLWSWLDWSNLLLLLLQLVLVVGVWIALLIFCVVKLARDHNARQRNRMVLEQRQGLQQQWFDELLQSKRDARLRKNKALDTELTLKLTRIPPGPDGNYAGILDPITGQVFIPPPGNFQQPVPRTFHYHQVVPGSVKVSEKEADQLSAPQFPPPRDFTEILQWFRPSMSGIYLADTIAEPVLSKVYELCHVGLGGKTGSGKTNATRLLTAQLLADEVQSTIYFASPNFSQVKLNGHRLEDWRPIVQRLAEPPSVEPDEIADLLNRFLQLFEQRRRQERQSPRRQRDIFLVLGEWPAIVARVKDAPDILNLLLREARQYGVHVVTEMQDTLVKTIGLSSGARENLRTGFYYGGDLSTAKVLLNLKAGESVNERGLGQKGAVYVRTYTNPPVPGRIPFFSNQALYLLLGAPPDPMPDEDISHASQVPETYYQVDKHGRYVESSVLKTDPDLDESEIPGTLTRSSFYAMPGLSPNPRRPAENVANRAPTEPRTGPLTSPVNRLPEQTGRGAQTVPAAQEVEDDGPELGPGDRMFTPEQEREFLLRYRRHAQQGIRDIKTTLRQMNHGQGLGNSYFKHASWLVKKHGLREA